MTIVTKNMSMTIWAILLSTVAILVHGSHFNGGTITWSPLDPNSNGSTVTILLTQQYSWSYPLISCTTNVPMSSSKPDTNLTCISNCSTDGGYSSSPVDIATDCISSSTALGMMTSERSVNITLNVGAYFYLAYLGSAWRSLYGTSGSLSWSISSLIDLRLRPDGFVNTPPVANVLSPQYVIVNTTNLINIPVSDVNTGDDLRCRWAVSGTIDECSGICYPGALPNGTTLSNCTVSFTSSVSGAWYSIAIQVEDFINKTSNQAMSSVPVQFLIYVQPTPACTIAPVMVGVLDCLQVEANVSTNFTLYVMNQCGSSATISQVIISQSISGMTASDIQNSTTNTSLSYITLSWTPQTLQIGIQTLCAYAYNSLIVRSTLYCVTFTVTSSSPSCPVTTVQTATATNTADGGGMNIPLIVGLSLAALIISLCCSFCWMYYCFRKNGKRRRQKVSKESTDQSKRRRLRPSFFAQKSEMKTWHNLSQLENTPNSANRIPSHRSTNSKLQLLNSNDQSYIAAKSMSQNIDESFSKQNFKSDAPQHRHCSVLKVSRNKVAAVDNPLQLNPLQGTDSFEHFTASANAIDDLTIHNTNSSMHYDSFLSIVPASKNGMTTMIQKGELPKKKINSKLNRSDITLTAVEKSREPSRGGFSSKNITVTHVKLRSASAPKRSGKDHGLDAFPGSIKEHNIHKVKAVAPEQKKEKLQSIKSKHRQINVHLNC